MRNYIPSFFIFGIVKIRSGTKWLNLKFESMIWSLEVIPMYMQAVNICYINYNKFRLIKANRPFNISDKKIDSMLQDGTNYILQK